MPRSRLGHWEMLQMQICRLVPCSWLMWAENAMHVSGVAGIFFLMQEYSNKNIH